MTVKRLYQWELTGTSKRLKDVPAGAEVTVVNGKHVAGRCRKCRKWIPSGVPYNQWSEGMSCLDCGP